MKYCLLFMMFWSFSAMAHLPELNDCFCERQGDTWMLIGNGGNDTIGRYDKLSKCMIDGFVEAFNKKICSPKSCRLDNGISPDKKYLIANGETLDANTRIVLTGYERLLSSGACEGYPLKEFLEHLNIDKFGKSTLQ